MEHSKLPWNYEEGTESNPSAVICNSVQYICQTVVGNDVDNAAFIVRAVNNHYALLDELKKAREVIANFPRSLGYDFTDLPRIDEAIKNAEK